MVFSRGMCLARASKYFADAIRLFGNVLTGVVLSNTQKAPARGRKVIEVGLTNLLTKTDATFKGTQQQYWSVDHLFNAPPAHSIGSQSSSHSSISSLFLKMSPIRTEQAMTSTGWIRKKQVSNLPFRSLAHRRRRVMIRWLTSPTLECMRCERWPSGTQSIPDR